MTGVLPDAPRWGGYSHEQIYHWVQAGTGQAASQYAEGQWSAMWFMIQYVEARLSAAVVEIGSGWEGQAATATTAGVTPLGAWALDTADQARRTNRALSAQASDAHHVQMSMPPPAHSALPEAPPTSIGVTRADLDDWSAQDVARDEQARRAVDLMRQYTTRSAANFVTFGEFTSPPLVVVDAASSGAAGGGVAVAGGGPGAAPAGIGEASAGAAAGGTVAQGTLTEGAGTPGASAPGAAGPSAVTPAVSPGAASVAVAGPNGTGGAPPTGLPGGTSPLPGGLPSGTPIGAGPVAPPRSPQVDAVRRPHTATGSGGPAGFSPVVPGLTRPGPQTAVPLGSFSGGVGSHRPGAPGSWPGSGSGPPGGPAASGGWFGRGPSVDGNGGRGFGEPLPPPGRPPARSPDNPFPSVGGTGDTTTRSGGRPGASAHPGLMPMGAGAGAGAGPQTHRRPDYLIEDGDPFADDRWFTPPVIGADDLENGRG